MFRVVLEEYRALCQRRKQLETDIVTRLATQPDFVRLQTLPGIGPILAMTILAEARDLRHFGCVLAVSEVLRPRSLYGAVGPIPWEHAPLETGKCAAAVRLLDGGHCRDPHATEQLSPEV